jgi:4-amino-4-deoxy-L-arabinose transferase-like glycosyltransferase
MTINAFIRHISLSLSAAILFMPFLGGVHLFDWDEINFAEAAREMIVSGDWTKVQINFEPFWEKPPLFFWLQALSMKVFGVNEFAARFPNAVCGIITLNLVYYIGRKHVSEKFSFCWVLCFIGSFTPFFFFKSGIIDPWYNLFIFSSLYVIYLAFLNQDNRSQLWLLAGLLVGFAVLTKGPVAILVVGLCVLSFWALNRFKPFFGVVSAFGFVLAMVLVPAIWFLPETLLNGPWFIRSFLKYQADLLLSPVASHGQPWYYHPLVLLVGCFPASVFALSKFLPQRGYSSELVLLKKMMIVLFWVVLILFSVVTTKIVHYSSLCYFPLTFLAALTVYDSIDSKKQVVLNKLQRIVLAILTIFWFLILTFVPLLANNATLKSLVISNLKDPFLIENIMATSNWNGFEWMIGVLFLAIWVWFFIRRRSPKAFIATLTVQFMLIFITLAFIVPQVEGHIQRSAIAFYKKHQKEDALFITYKFKSYAPYFYGKVKPSVYDSSSLEKRNKILRSLKSMSFTDLSAKQKDDFEYAFRQWLIDSVSSQKAYIVASIYKAEELDNKVLLERLYQQGGYVFYRKRNSTSQLKPVQ